MNNEEILKAAIEKAVKNGYKVPMLERETLTFNIGSRAYGKNNSITLWRNGWIMSHDFAKAFFKEEKVKVFVPAQTYTTYKSKVRIMRGSHYVTRVKGRSWQYHLQQMVIYENPIEYLWKFL
jgi:hypothetical protein